MDKYNEVDIGFYQFDESGSPIIEGDVVFENGDIKLTGEFESARQDITNRIRTQTGDWRSHPKIGGDLELLEGEPNTRDTANRGVNQINQTLTFDNRFNPDDITIRPVPVRLDQIDYYVFLDAGKSVVVKKSQNL
jgi:hypothetical protein